MIMNHKLEYISLAQAKSIAEQHAYSDLKEFVGTPSDVLKDEYLEGECCWMFFRSDKINVPLDVTLGLKWAHVVSKKGTYSMVQDFSDNQQKLYDYLQTMSDYFKKKDE